MKCKLVLLFLAVLQSFPITARAEPDPNFHIYIAFGQSNMESGGKMEAMDRSVDKRFQVLADSDNPNRGWKKGTWYDAIPPLAARGRGISLVDYFGRTMVANMPEKIRVGVVKLSVSGTKIELWDKDSYKTYLANLPAADSWKINLANQLDGNPYKYLIDLAKIAQKDGVIKGILIHQGESNVDDPDWPKKVKKVYENLMKDLNLQPESVPLLAGEVVNADQKGEKAAFNDILKKLPDTLPNSYVISSAGLPCNPDHLHFTAEGLREFGKRYAEKMLPLEGFKFTAQSVPAPGSKLLPAEANRTITATELTAERVGSSIPISAIGEPVSAVNLSQPRWVENANGGYGVVDGAIMPVDPKSKPVNFRVMLPASWSRRAAHLAAC